MQTFTKKLSVLVLALAFVGTSVMPARAHAQLVVNDPINYIVNGLTSVATGAISINSASMFAKEYMLDPLIWQLRTIAIQSIVRSTVNWINSGFQGSPAFVTDLEGRLRTVADTKASEFLQQLEMSGAINSPFRDVIAQGIRAEYYRATSKDGFFAQNGYSLNSYSEDPAAFTRGDFSKGGFNAWFAAQKRENNPIAAYIDAQNELSSRVRGAQETEKTQLNWGDGFRPFKGDNCVSPEQAAADASNVVSLEDKDPCLGKSVVLAGTTIKTTLDKVYNSGIDQYLTADEFSEIINALAGQLMTKALGGTGLLGLSQPSAGGGPSYLDQASQPAQQTAATGGTSSGASVLSQSISEQRTQIQKFQSNWQKIQTAANSAKACAPNNTTVQTTLTRAAQNLAKASTALSALDKIASDLTAAQSATGAAQSTKLQAVFQAYQSLFSSGTLPSGQDLMVAEEQSSNTQGSLYYQLQNTCSTVE